MIIKETFQKTILNCLEKMNNSNDQIILLKF